MRLRDFKKKKRKNFINAVSPFYLDSLYAFWLRNNFKEFELALAIKLGFYLSGVDYCA